MTKLKYVFWGLLVVILLLVLGYFYMYKEHRDIGEERPDFSTTTVRLNQEYQEDIEAATMKYLDKIIELEGKVTDVESDNFTLDDVVLCYADSITMSRVKLNATLIIKGRSIGYDELLEYIKLDFITIMKN